GLKFIERSVAYELRGQAQLNFRAQGLHVAIRVPLAENEAEPSHPAEGDGARLKSPRYAHLPKKLRADPCGPPALVRVPAIWSRAQPPGGRVANHNILA